MFGLGRNILGNENYTMMEGSLEILKEVPGLELAHGSARSVIYTFEKKEKDAIRSTFGFLGSSLEILTKQPILMSLTPPIITRSVSKLAGEFPDYSDDETVDKKYDPDTNTFRQDLLCHIPEPQSVMGVKPGLRVLCIDGGGIRGLVPIEILDRFENANPNKPVVIKNYFDFFAGTSTGGIIALYLALGRSTAECRKLYLKLKTKVFGGIRVPFVESYSEDVLEAQLKKAFGDDTKMSDIKDVKVAITACTGTKNNLERVLFTNYDDATKDEYVWKVARMTSAAPTYFDPFHHSDGKIYNDGGMLANNPTQATLTAINKLGGDHLKNGTILSLGTGKFPPTKTQLDLTSTINPVTLIGNKFAFLNTLITQISKSDGEVVEDAMATCSQAKCFYYRLTPTLPEAIELDETNDDKLTIMRYHAVVYSNVHSETIKEILERVDPKPSV